VFVIYSIQQLDLSRFVPFIMASMQDPLLPTSQTFEDMINEDDQPPQSYLDDEFTCVSLSEHSISTKASGVYKKKNKSKNDRKGDKIVKYIQNRKVVIEMFPSSDVTGAAIKSAADGIVYTTIPVGSFGENLFFKVRNTTSKDGVKSYFYSSPEEYERHTLNTITDDIKKTWSEKYAHASSVLKMNV